MHLRLSTQWNPLLTFINDLKAGVQPWLVPEREFLVVPPNEVVRRVAGELKERHLREKEGKERGEVEVGDGKVEEEEEEEDGKRWRVVEVLIPRTAGGMGEGKREGEGEAEDG